MTLKKPKKPKVNPVNNVKKLYRSKSDKIIAGVCGGLGEYFALDAVWIRLGFLLFAFLDGIGILAYIIAWIIIPENPSKTIKTQSKSEKVSYPADTIIENSSGNGYVVLGLIFLILGSMLLLKNAFNVYLMKYFWPAMFIILGLYFIVRKK